MAPATRPSLSEGRATLRVVPSRRKSLLTIGSSETCGWCAIRTVVGRPGFARRRPATLLHGSASASRQLLRPDQFDGWSGRFCF